MDLSKNNLNGQGIRKKNGEISEYRKNGWWGWLKSTTVPDARRREGAMQVGERWTHRESPHTPDKAVSRRGR
jgi:hypothetical protein